MKLANALVTLAYLTGTAIIAFCLIALLVADGSSTHP